MNISKKEIVFDNGLTIDIDDSFETLLNKFRKIEALDVEESKYISFESDDMVSNYLADVTVYYFKGKIDEVEIDFDLHEYANKEFKDYTEFMDSNKKFLNELKEYVLRQFPGCEVLGDNDNSITIVVDNLLVGVTTGREFEDVVMHITSKDNPAVEY